MTKSGRAERSKPLFAHAVLASILEEQLVQKHFDNDDDRPNPSRVRPPQHPPISKGLILKLEKHLKK